MKSPCLPYCPSLPAAYRFPPSATKYRQRSGALVYRGQESSGSRPDPRGQIAVEIGEKQTEAGKLAMGRTCRGDCWVMSCIIGTPSFLSSFIKVLSTDSLTMVAQMRPASFLTERTVYPVSPERSIDECFAVFRLDLLLGHFHPHCIFTFSSYSPGASGR